MDPDNLRETLKDVLEWFTNDGFVNDVHYDDASIIAQIQAALQISEIEGR